jgi:hypothetical protein
MTIAPNDVLIRLVTETKAVPAAHRHVKVEEMWDIIHGGRRVGSNVFPYSLALDRARVIERQDNQGRIYRRRGQSDEPEQVWPIQAATRR